MEDGLSGLRGFNREIISLQRSSEEEKPCLQEGEVKLGLVKGKSRRKVYVETEGSKNNMSTEIDRVW